MSHDPASAHTEPEPHTLAVGERGRVVIPAELRRALGIGRGSTLVAHVEAGRRLVLEDRAALVADMRGAWRHPLALEGIASGTRDVVAHPGTASVQVAAHDLTAELLAERRAEAALEQARVSGASRGAILKLERVLSELRERHDTTPSTGRAG